MNWISRLFVLGALGAFGASLFFAGDGLEAESAFKATWSCGSVAQPKRFGIPELGELDPEAIAALVAGQTACAEERDAQAAKTLQFVVVAGALGALAVVVRPSRGVSESKPAAEVAASGVS